MVNWPLSALRRLCGFFDSRGSSRADPGGTVPRSQALGHMTTLDPKIATAIRSRMQGIREWMADEAPYVTADQRHLDANTPERAYWHYGYQAALGDVLRLIESHTSEAHHTPRPDTSS